MTTQKFTIMFANNITEVSIYRVKKRLEQFSLSNSLEVFVQEAGCHEHIENPDFIEKSSGFRWKKLATDMIVTGIKNGATPKVI